MKCENPGYVKGESKSFHTVNSRISTPPSNLHSLPSPILFTSHETAKDVMGQQRVYCFRHAVLDFAFFSVCERAK